MNFRRITIEDVSNERFYKMPKFLFEDILKEISNDAKVLYSLLKDRHSLSLQNNWYNDYGEIFLIYTRENMADMLGCSIPTARKAFNVLKKYGLVSEERQGLNKPNLIFLNLLTVENTRTEKSFQSREKNSFSQEGKNLSPNDTDCNKTERKETKRVLLPGEECYLSFYLKTFKEYIGMEHMKVKESNYNQIVEAIEMLKLCNISLEEWQGAVTEHFNTLPKSNNGNILAFLKAFYRYFEIDV